MTSYPHNPAQPCTPTDDARDPACLNVLVLHWQDPSGLRLCLNAVQHSDYTPIRVIVIENGSSAAAVAEVRQCAEEFRAAGLDLHLVLNVENLGYAGGNNAGLRYLQEAGLGGDLCILNPDVAVGTDTLGVLKHALAPGVGLAMCRTCSVSGVVLYDAVKLRGYRQHFFQSDAPVTETDYAQGACFTVRRQCADAGLFDEQFFLYWEEVELALRVRRAGYRVISTSATTIRRSENSPRRLPTALYYSIRNGRLLMKGYPEMFSFTGYCAYAMQLTLLLIKLLPHPSLFQEGVTSLLSGLRDGAAGKFGKRVTRDGKSKRATAAAAKGAGHQERACL